MKQLLDAVAVQPAIERKIDERPASQLPAWLPISLVLSVLALYGPILAKLIHDWWNDPNFSHGFFVPLFSAYLVWEKWGDIKRIPVRGSWFGMIVVLGSLATMTAGVFGVELFLSRVSLILLIAGLVILFAGWQWLRALLFPWICLFLMVPIPTIVFNNITLPLQLLASRLASDLLPLFNVPVLRQGNVIQLPAMPLEVAEACSGIRSLLSLTTLAIMYGYFLEKSVAKRILLAVFAVPIAVAANAARIVGTGLMVQYWDPEKAVGFFHEFSGWVIFIVSLLLLFAVHAAMTLFHGKKQLVRQES